MSIVGRTYLEKGKPVTVLIQWALTAITGRCRYLEFIRSAKPAD